MLLAALVVLYLTYLGIRIWQERADVGPKIDRIIATADANELALPKSRVDALLKVEDPTFWTNKGIDLSTPGAGMTSLSQALGKRIFFNGFEPGLAKGELMALTRFALYPQVSKERTLQAFVASAYLGTHRGREVIGYADGAQTWFGKPLEQLTDDEYLGLIAIQLAPDRLKPGRDDTGRAERVRRIKRLLASQCEPSGLRDVQLDGCDQ